MAKKETNKTEVEVAICDNKQTASDGEIILYQPHDDVIIEVRLIQDTIWLTQAQIAELFGTKRPAITKHLSNIYKCGELDEASTCSILEHMGNDGKQKYITRYYNLDAILSVGNSINATQFRRWAEHGEYEKAYWELQKVVDLIISTYQVDDYAKILGTVKHKIYSPESCKFSLNAIYEIYTDVVKMPQKQFQADNRTLQVKLVNETLK
jgi:hypothetical protein